MVTEEDYDRAIENLRLGRKQLYPDGNCCSICEDTGHQAWECHHNPLSYKYIHRGFWRCFHCNTVFTVISDAEEHFGKFGEHDKPACCRDEEAT